eukprot:TRINITY_DN7412_c0_g3_i2.p1 TRINITY_DN7412_c0_g3~~TRINITY_DN7412_c0_g3_i2.p1  ORF type:complete len:564 (+),score=98.44 TRINITY_DN7412_c0_g3_i2:58-1692(+)
MAARTAASMAFFLAGVFGTGADEVRPLNLILLEGSLTVLGGLRNWGTPVEKAGLPSANISLKMNASTLATAPAATSAATTFAVDTMDSVCRETLRFVDDSVQSEKNISLVRDKIALVCEEVAGQRLSGSNATETEKAPIVNALRESCSNLEGRLTLALEVGFFSVRSPSTEKQQAAHNEGATASRPIVPTTRRLFCQRFAEAASKSVASARSTTNATVPGTRPDGTSAKAGSSDIAPSSVSTPSRGKGVDGEASKRNQSTEVSGAVEATSVQDDVGINMLRLVQVISSHNSPWERICRELLSGLTSQEASVSDQEILGQGPDSDWRRASAVLTFNAADQAGIQRCSGQLKALGIASGAFRPSTAQNLRGQQAQLSLSEFSTTVDTDAFDETALADAAALETFVESPWARDACGDLARGYLTARLEHPDSTLPAQFCPRYAQDLRDMRVEPIHSSADDRRKQALEDVLRLRRRALEKVRPTLAKAVAGLVSPAASKITLSSRVASAAEPAMALTARGMDVMTKAEQPQGDEDAAGARFWMTGDSD